MKHSQKRSELREAVASLKPYFVRAAWFSVACSLLVLALLNAPFASKRFSGFALLSVTF